MSKVSGACTPMVGCSADGEVPGLEAHAGDEFAGAAGRGSGTRAAVAGDDVTAFAQALDFDLQPLDRGIDEAHGAAGDVLFAQHVPGLDRLPQFEPHAAMTAPRRRAGNGIAAALRTRPDRRRSRRA